MRKWLLAILAVGLLIRICAAFSWQTYNVAENHLRFGDSDSYWHLARTIATGEPYQYGSPNAKIFRAPLYPIFLSPWAKLLADGKAFSWNAIFAARIAGCVAGTLCIAMLAYGSMRLTRQAPLEKNFCEHRSCKLVLISMCATGILASLYPGAIGMSIFILSESIFCPLMIACLITTSFAIDRLRRLEHTKALAFLFLAGLISGAACLSRPSWSLWPAFLFPYLAIVVHGIASPVTSNLGMRLRIWTKCCLIFCAGICICMSPWWARNFTVSRKFVPTTLQVGASLYDGWHAGASGSSDENMAFVDVYAAEQANEDRQLEVEGNRLDGTFEWRLDRRLRNAAIKWATTNSSAALSLGLVKLVKTWSPLPVARELGSNAVRWSEGIGYSTIMLLAGIGLWRSRNQPGAWLYALPCLYFAILHMFFIGSVRYRQPAVLVLCVLGGLGVSTLLAWYARLKERTVNNIDGSITTTSHVKVDTTQTRKSNQ